MAKEKKIMHQVYMETNKYLIVPSILEHPVYLTKFSICQPHKVACKMQKILANFERKSITMLKLASKYHGLFSGTRSRIFFFFFFYILERVFCKSGNKSRGIFRKLRLAHMSKRSAFLPPPFLLFSFFLLLLFRSTNMQSSNCNS